MNEIAKGLVVTAKEFGKIVLYITHMIRMRSIWREMYKESKCVYNHNSILLRITENNTHKGRSLQDD